MKLRTKVRTQRRKDKSIQKVLDRIPTVEEEDCPSVVDSEVSSISSISEFPSGVTLQLPTTAPKRESLQWEFKGLTLWLEFEEFDRDLSRLNETIASKYGVDPIPTMHATAIYGMEHLAEEEAMRRLNRVKEVLPNEKWPKMDKPVAVKQDIAQEGLPGQVCSIAWAELTLKTSEQHEKAMDALYRLFDVERPAGLWTPHISIAYDNPEDSIFQLCEIIGCSLSIPSILQNERKVKAISLWSTKGKMEDWKCLDRVNF